MSKYIRAENITYPLAYAGGVFAHPAEQEELRELIERSGSKGQVAAKLEMALRYLDDHGHAAVNHKAWFEKLKGEDFYALRISCTVNIRILYTFYGKRPVLLHAFLETKKATARTDSYRAACIVAQKRAEDIALEGE